MRAYVPFKSQEIRNSRLVSEALLDCIKAGDVESFREVLVAHLMTANKSKLAKKAEIGVQTLYDLLDPEKESIRGNLPWWR